jgi:hypothetical protein
MAADLTPRSAIHCVKLLKGNNMAAEQIKYLKREFLKDNPYNTPNWVSDGIEQALTGSRLMERPRRLKASTNTHPA